MQLNKLVWQAGFVVGMVMDSLEMVAKRRTLCKLLSIMDNNCHPLHTSIMKKRSMFRGRLLSQSCSTDRLLGDHLSLEPSGFSTLPNLGEAKLSTLSTGPEAILALFSPAYYTAQATFLLLLFMFLRMSQEAAKRSPPGPNMQMCGSHTKCKTIFCKCYFLKIFFFFPLFFSFYITIV